MPARKLLKMDDASSCPECGERTFTIEVVNKNDAKIDTHLVRINCYSCGFKGPKVEAKINAWIGEGVHEAVKLWNRLGGRKPSPANPLISVYVEGKNIEAVPPVRPEPTIGEMTLRELVNAICDEMKRRG